MEVGEYYMMAPFVLPGYPLCSVYPYLQTFPAIVPEDRNHFIFWRKEDMKRRLALLLSAAMLTVSLAGCGGGNSSSSGNAGSGNASGEAAGGGAAGGAAAGHKETLIIGTDTDINNLDLQKQQDQINNIEEHPSDPGVF